MWYFTFMRIKIYELTCKRHLKKNWDFIWGYYLPVSIFSEKSQLLYLRWGWKNVGGTHIWEKSQIWEKTRGWVWVWEKIYLVAHFGEEKLKFSEKSQIWENLSVGGPEASTLCTLPTKELVISNIKSDLLLNANILWV